MDRRIVDKNSEHNMKTEKELLVQLYQELGFQYDGTDKNKEVIKQINRLRKLANSYKLTSVKKMAKKKK